MLIGFDQEQERETMEKRYFAPRAELLVLGGNPERRDVEENAIYIRSVDNRIEQIRNGVQSIMFWMRFYDFVFNITTNGRKTD